MVASFFLSIREGLEAALIIGILLAALKKLDRKSLNYVVWRGVFAAAVVSLVAGLALTWLDAEIKGRPEEILEGTIMIAAAALLTWMIFWMRRQAPFLQKRLEAEVRQASASPDSQRAIFWLAFLAVGREGFELVLFLIAAQMASGAAQTLLGAAIGLSSAVALGWMLFATSKRLSLRHFFSVTSILLVLFAAGLVAHGIHELNEAGVIPAVIEHLWDFNHILNEKYFFGQLLTALFGYNANPSLTEVLAYLAYFLSLTMLWNRSGQKLNPPLAA